MTELKDRVAVVTGAASGIGFAIAKALAQRGAHVVLADIEEEALSAAEKAISEIGTRVLPVRTDVSKYADVEALCSKAYSEFGAVHVLCNNAGVFRGGMRGRFIWERTLDDWNWILGVNLWGVAHGIKAFVPRMKSQGTECHIVNTASMAGLVALPFLGLYTATKHAVVGLTETLYRELQIVDSKIGASVLCPVWTQSRLGQAGRNRPPITDTEAQENASDLDDTAMNMSDYLRRVYAQYPSEIAEKMGETKEADEVGAAVVNAILNDQFYIFTHPSWMNVIAKRFDEILHVRNPDFLM